MTTILAICAAGGWLTPTESITLTGDAAFYAPGRMAQVIDYRDADLGGFAGGVALMSCGDLGREVWLQFPDDVWTGPYLVVDCAQRDHYHYLVDQLGRVVDVCWETWHALHLPLAPVSVTVRFTPPAPDWDGLGGACRPI